jgi:hypothetical protein
VGGPVGHSSFYGTLDVGDMYLSKKLQLLAPGAVVFTPTPLLQWAPFPGATRYTATVHNDRTSELVFLGVTAATEITVSPALVYGETYQWSVYAENAGGVQIAYWSAWYFTVQ